MDIHFFTRKLVHGLKKPLLIMLLVVFFSEAIFQNVSEATYVHGQMSASGYKEKRHDLTRLNNSVRVLDKIIPDKCRGSRKRAHDLSLSAIITCSVAAACAAESPFCWMFVPALSGACAGIAISAGVFLGKYDSCCNGLQKDSQHGWSKGELMVAAKCYSCMTKENTMRDTCGQ